MFLKLCSDAARCPPCKASYLEALLKNSQRCNDFKSGNCAYGDKCRYSHELPLVSMHIAIDDESSDDLDLDCYWSITKRMGDCNETISLPCLDHELGLELF